MTNSVNYQNQPVSPYSGITINITNPVLNPPGNVQPCKCDCCCGNETNQHVSQVYTAGTTTQQYINKGEYLEPVNTEESSHNVKQNYDTNSYSTNTINTQVERSAVDNPTENTPQPNFVQNLNQTPQNQNSVPNTYPPAYYMNNYNIIRNENSGNKTETQDSNNMPEVVQIEPDHKENNEDSSSYEQTDNSVSKEIINELEVKEAEQKELEKSGKKTKVVALTNEYIMSLENYLNNPNTEIRLMAAKDILTRFDEDHNRYDDAALNALLNKMLQDPNKLVRIAAMSALASELASGNDYTVELLNNIQQNPNADPEDVLEASQILLKRSATTEIRYIPQQQTEEIQQKAE